MKPEVVWERIKLLEANQVWSKSKTGENRRRKVGSRELSISSSLPPLLTRMCPNLRVMKRGPWWMA